MPEAADIGMIKEEIIWSRGGAPPLLKGWRTSFSYQVAPLFINSPEGKDLDGSRDSFFIKKRAII